MYRLNTLSHQNFSSDLVFSIQGHCVFCRKICTSAVIIWHCLLWTHCDFDFLRYTNTPTYLLTYKSASKSESNGFEIQNPNPTDSDFIWFHHSPIKYPQRFSFRDEAQPGVTPEETGCTKRWLSVRIWYWCDTVKHVEYKIYRHLKFLLWNSVTD